MHGNHESLVTILFQHISPPFTCVPFFVFFELSPLFIENMSGE